MNPQCCNDSIFQTSNGSIFNSSTHDDHISRDGDSEHAIVKMMQEPPLIESNFAMAVIYIILMVAALSIGTVGNILILISSCVFRGLRKHGFVFVINLAAADLCVAGIADPMCVIAVLKGEAWFNDKQWLCETVAAMCLTACFCAFLSLTLASVNRYVFVCHNMLYAKLFTKKMCVIMCISAWLMAFTFEFPNFVGWGDHAFDKKSHQCIWDRTASLSYTVIVSVCLIGGPLVTMAMCYILIFIKIYSTKANLYKMDHDDPDYMKKVWSETLKSSRMLCIIFIIFVLLWSPYAVVIAADVKDAMPVSLHLFVTMLAHLHSSVNFCVYIGCNKNFRVCVLRLLRCDKLTHTGLLSETRSTSGQKMHSVSGTVSSKCPVTAEKEPKIA